MPVPPPAHLDVLEDNQDGLDGDGEEEHEQTESVEFAEADLHSVPFSVPKKGEMGEMRVSSVLHHLVAVSTELQLGAVFTSHQSLQMGRLGNLFERSISPIRDLTIEVLGGDFIPTWCFDHGSASVLKTTLAFDICQMPSQ